MKALVIILALVLVAFTALAAVDLSGTWKGKTEVDGMEVELTMVLEKSGDTYTGKISDSAGFSDESEIRDFEFEEGKISFTFTIYNGSEYMDVTVSGQVEGDKLTGSWESEDGNSGSVEMAKQ